MKKNFIIIWCVLVFGFLGCQTSHEVELKPVEIKPIHITIDINVKIDRALDNFFDDIDKAENQIKDSE